MNSITVSIQTETEGEIKKFLESYYNEEVHMDEDVGEWECIYGDPLKSVDIISSLMDNIDNFNLDLRIMVNDEKPYHITSENYEDVIKGMFCLFYDGNK